MPTSEEEVSRIIGRIEGRVTRLEESNFEEGVPNPLLAASEISRSTDSTAVASQPSGGAQWGVSKWGASEFAGGSR